MIKDNLYFNPKLVVPLDQSLARRLNLKAERPRTTCIRKYSQRETIRTSAINETTMSLRSSTTHLRTQISDAARGRRPSSFHEGSQTFSETQIQELQINMLAKFPRSQTNKLSTLERSMDKERVSEKSKPKESQKYKTLRSQSFQPVEWPTQFSLKNQREPSSAYKIRIKQFNQAGRRFMAQQNNQNIQEIELKYRKLLLKKDQELLQTKEKVREIEKLLYFQPYSHLKQHNLTEDQHTSQRINHNVTLEQHQRLNSVGYY